MMPDTQPKVAGRSWLRFLIGFTLLWGVLAGLGEIDASGRWGLAIFAAVAAAAVIVEVIVYKTSVRAAVRHLGLGRPNPRAVAVAAAVSILILLVYPLTTAVTGADIQLVRTGRGSCWGSSPSTGWPRRSSGAASPFAGSAPADHSGPPFSGRCR